MKNPARNLLRYWRIFTDQQVVRMYGLKVSTSREVPEALRRSLFKGTWEYDAVGMIKEVVRPGDKVLEIGVGLGVTSLVATQKAGEGNVLCFEADSSLEGIIRSNYRLNGWEANLVMQPITSDGRSVRLFRTETYKPQSTSLFEAKERPSESDEVASQSIGEVLEKHPPDIVIMDAEGAEAELLPLATLPKTRAAIVEMHPPIIGSEAVEGLVEAMKRNGFDLVRKGRRNRGPLHRYPFWRPPPSMYDCLFERPAPARTG